MLSCDEDSQSLQLAGSASCCRCMSVQAKTLGMRTWKFGTPESKHLRSSDEGVPSTVPHKACRHVLCYRT